MKIPEAADLFLNVFANRLNVTDAGLYAELARKDWGTIWVNCCAIAREIEAAQALADEAIEIAEHTPAQVWPPQGIDS